jgi:protein tyrosine phosphatase (PTP) superfamily phosphohydrolase (DUF442 family)
MTRRGAQRVALALAGWIAGGAQAEPAARPEGWAVRVERPGLPNFYKVSDGYYRGAQPTAAGYRELHRLGVRTVVSLRRVSDRGLIGRLPLGYEHIGMSAWHPEDEDVVRFLRVVGDARRQPVFVHCQYGADRTGMMTAVYRVAVQGWSKDEAIREMTDGGFGHHRLFAVLVDYLRRTDLESLARTAGVQRR